jgi:hypothetical protein
MVWPASPVVARAYLDQLGRTNGITAERAGAVTTALARADRSSGAAAALATDLEALATGLEEDAEDAVYHDVRRLRSLAETLRGIATTLR